MNVTGVANRQIDVSHILRWRWLLLAAWGALLAVPTFHRGHQSRAMDWYVLRHAGRMLFGLDPGGLHLYARHPDIQVGPPAVALDGLAQWTFGSHGDAIVAVMIVGLALVTIWGLEGVAALTWPRQTAQLVAFGAGLLLMTVWAADLGGYGHIEDALALAGVAVAARCTGRGAWLPAALALGLAVACKPWAIVAVPLLWGLPARRPRALMVIAGIALAPWLPFVIADIGTLDAGHYWWPVVNGSGLHALGAHVQAVSPSWLRPVQLAAGFAAAALAARKSWISAPLAGMAIKVAMDPETWPYYGVAPLVAAALLDVHRGRRVPIWSISVLIVEYVIGPYATGTVAGYVRVGWALVAITLLIWRPGTLLNRSGLGPRRVRVAATVEP